MKWAGVNSHRTVFGRTNKEIVRLVITSLSAALSGPLETVVTNQQPTNCEDEGRLHQCQGASWYQPFEGIQLITKFSILAELCGSAYVRLATQSNSAPFCGGHATEYFIFFTGQGLLNLSRCTRDTT